MTTNLTLNDEYNFMDAYVELCNKETEELIAEETEQFLQQSISYLKSHLSEFIYIESDHFSKLGTDSVCLEVDDVFGTYEVMLGLKLQKKYENEINTYLTNVLKEDAKFSLLFSQADGLWDFNLALESIEGFREEMNIREVCQLIIHLMNSLIEVVKDKK